MKTTWAAGLMGMVLSVPFALLLAAPQAVLAQAAPVATAPGLAQGRGPGADPADGWNSWNKFQCDVSEQLIRETAGRHGRHRHEGCRLPVHQHRRLLARRARRARFHPSGRQALSERHEGAGRLHPQQRAQDRHLLRRRLEDLRRPPRQPGLQEFQDAQTYAGVGHRLPEVRLGATPRA